MFYFYRIFILFLLIPAFCPPLLASVSERHFLESCPISNDLKLLLSSSEKMGEYLEHRLSKDITARLAQGYSNNEITPLSSERLSTSLQLRWKNILGYKKSYELGQAQSKSQVAQQRFKAKQFLVDWLKPYFTWKWTSLSQSYLQLLSKFTLKRSQLNLGGRTNMKNRLKWLEYHHKLQAHLVSIKNFQNYFSNCERPPEFKMRSEVDTSEFDQWVALQEVDKDLASFCRYEKDRIKLELVQNNKPYDLSFSTSYAYNQQLVMNGRNFNDARVMVELEIPLDFKSIPAMPLNQCELELHNVKNETVEKKETLKLYKESLDLTLKAFKNTHKLLDSAPGYYGNLSDEEAMDEIGMYIISLDKLILYDYEMSSEYLANQQVDKIK